MRLLLRQQGLYDPGMIPTIRSALTTASTPEARLRELSAVLQAPDNAFVLLFCGPDQAEGLEGQGAAATVFGCTTSGEISPAGYGSDSVVALGFPRGDFCAVSRRIDGLRGFGFADARELVLSATWELRERAPASDPGNTFALLLIDSTAQAEEFVAAALGSELGNVPLVGGSAGDNWRLARTPVLEGGRWHDDAAVLLMVHTRRAFRCGSVHHFRPSAVRAVVTSATPSARLVHEINGAPAIGEYARLCGLPPGEIDVEQLSARPLMLLVGDKAHARGFAQVLDDGSMRFACAIDEGMVFRVAEPGDMVGELDAHFGRLRAELGAPELVLAFECAARRTEAERGALQPAVRALFAANHVWGFSCMGEQSNAIHMNNSFNSIAFARGPHDDTR
jgi:hypothetical protein